MAKKKNNPDNLMNFDFLPNMSQPTGGGLFAQLARLGQVQRQEPLYDIAKTQAFLKPITKMMQEAQANITAGMMEYNEANPDIDDSLLFNGTEEQLNTQLQNNNRRFKELNRKLGFMDTTSEKYAETVKEINKINKSNLNLRDQNTKLMNLKNLIKTKNLQEVSTGTPAHLITMYKDIQQGNSKNFDTDNEGNLIWNNPNKESKYGSVTVNSLPAEGPEFEQGEANDEAYDTFLKIRQIPKDELQPEDAYNRVDRMVRKIGDPGLKALAFDNMNNPNSPVGDTNEWWKTYAKAVGIESESVAGVQLLEDIKNNGMLHTENGVRAKDHFENWLKEQSMNAPKFGKGIPPKPTTPKEEDVLLYNRPLNETLFTVKTDQGTDTIKPLDIKNAVDLFKNIEKEGKGDFTAYNGITYSLRNGQWSEAGGKRLKRTEIFNALNWLQLGVVEAEGLDLNPYKISTSSGGEEEKQDELTQITPLKILGFTTPYYKTK